MREKSADLDKQLNVIDNVNCKIYEQFQKLLDAGYLQADTGMLRTVLTATDRLAADKMMATHDKYCTLTLTEIPNQQQLL